MAADEVSKTFTHLYCANVRGHVLLVRVRSFRTLLSIDVHWQTL